MKPRLSPSLDETRGSAQKLLQFLRLRGTLGIELTEYEWESAHYVTRAILKVIAPEAGIEAKEPVARPADATTEMLPGD
jgi:hypothetical protein